MKSKKSFSETPTAPHTRHDLSAVGEILTLLAKTVSALKIFPSEHALVKKQIHNLWVKLDGYLEEKGNLEIGVNELAFTYGNTTVYEEKKTIRSLPFLFYKDGMQKLTFFKGLKRRELERFIETIKKAYELPPEESDIVHLLWKEDFAHIRYHAPDEFLEAKISRGNLAELDVDPDTLFSGRIDLDRDDRKALENVRQHQQKVKEQDLTKDVEMPPLSEQETRILEAMLMANRRVSAEHELILLLTEMLLIEEDSKRTSALLQTAAAIHRNLALEGNFSAAHLLISNVREIKIITSPENEEKKALIQKFLQEARSRSQAELIQNSVVKGKVKSYQLFFAYLGLLFEHESVPFIADFFERVRHPEFRKKAKNFFTGIARENPRALLEVADDARTDLTKTIIHALGEAQGEKAVESLGAFVDSKNKSIRKEAIRALGLNPGLSSSNALLRFMHDEEEEVRILAAKNMKFLDSPEVREHIHNIILDKGFRKKGQEEKKAFLAMVSRNLSENSSALLADMIKKPFFLRGRKHTETQLLAVQVLEHAGTPDAKEILKTGCRARKRKVRKACKKALVRLGSSGSFRVEEAR